MRGFKDHTRNNLRCGGRREFKIWGRRNGRIVGDDFRNKDGVRAGLDGLGRCKYLLGRNELESPGYLRGYRASGTTGDGLELHGGCFVGQYEI